MGRIGSEFEGGRGAIPKTRPPGALYRPPGFRYTDPQNAKSPTSMTGLSA